MKKRGNCTPLSGSIISISSREEFTETSKIIGIETFSNSACESIYTKRRKVLEKLSSDASGIGTTSEDSDSETELSERKALSPINPNTTAKRYAKLLEEGSAENTFGSEDFTDDKWSKYIGLGSELPKGGSNTSQGI